MKNIIKAICLLLLLVCIQGCTVGPDYVRPKMPTPRHWRERDCQEVQCEPWAKWWKTFKDPTLNYLVKEAIHCNLDYKIALAKVRAARGLYITAKAPMFPRIDFSASAQQYDLSQSFPYLTVSDSYTVYDAHFDAFWELDIFGRTKRNIESSLANLGSYVENSRDILITLISETARNYIELKGLQEQLDIAYQLVELQRELVQMAIDQEREAVASKIDISRAKSALTAAEANIPKLRTAVFQTMNRIAYILGRLPGSLNCLLGTITPMPLIPCEIPIGLPSTLLLRRPDVREAERDLARATADVGVAVAEYFPKFGLLGAQGQLSLDLKTFANSVNANNFYGFNVSWPLFAGGQIEGYVKYTEARKQEALFNYAKAVLNALHDVENSLIAYNDEYTRYMFLNADEIDKSYIYENTALIAKEGIAPHSDVIQAKIDLLIARNNSIESRIHLSSDLIFLYKALGGGWQYIDKTDCCD